MSDVAIVGMSVLLPGAASVEAFWDNVVHCRPQIRPLGDDRWPRAAYFGRAPLHGGFVPDLIVHPEDFGLPPRLAGSISATQVVALELCRRALDDAGGPPDAAVRERTAVILAANNRGDSLFDLLVTRSMLPLICDDAARLSSRLPEWTEQSFPGVLDNIVAGRIAGRFDFGGPSYVVDSACASALTAIELAVLELRSGRSDLVITGGVDLGLDAYQYAAFDATRALSPRGAISAFQPDADGTVLGEGGALLVLRRLKDAERDGHRVYAVIKGVGSANDGREGGIVSPSTSGQTRAIRRALADGGIDAASVGLYEAHATGTPIGDSVERDTMRRSYGDGTAPCFVGALKSLIGHTRNASGAAAVVKAALALFHRTIPPERAGAFSPSERFQVAAAATPWESNRRAGVSAFGFGGCSAHVVLEEAAPSSRERASRPASVGSGRAEWLVRGGEIVVLRAAAASSADAGGDLAALLFQIVEEHTGHAAGSLRPDLLIQGDLGIDSLMWVEIQEAFERRVPPHVARALEERRPTYDTPKTFDELLSVVRGAPAILERPAPPADDCPRWIMTAEEAPCTRLRSWRGPHLVIGDGPVARALVEVLHERQCPAQTMAPWADASFEGPLAGIVDLSALSDGILVPVTLGAWREQSALLAKPLFRAVRRRALAPDALVLVASRFGGSYGRLALDAAASPLGGAAQALARCLAEEIPSLRARAVDLDASLAPAELARLLADELTFDSNEREVGYPGGRRTAFVPRLCPLPSRGSEGGLGGMVILAVGGAGGITAEALSAVAERSSACVLVGRAPADARLAAVERLRRGFGRVEYVSADMTDENAVRACLDHVYARYGRIDVAVHGAGLIRDAGFAHKDESDFDLVFRAKADAGFLLAKHLRPESLKTVVFMSSIVSRIGNHGQSDYAAGNEALNRLAWQLRGAWPRARVKSLSWGPWSDVGMAGGAVGRRLRARGFALIPPGAGAQAFRRELLFGGDDAEVILGHWPRLDTPESVP